VGRLGGIRLNRMVRRVLLFAVVGFLILAESSAAATRPSVVLITLDSTRADRMGFLGGRGALTPKLDAIAKQSVVFEQAYAQAPTTVTSHATLLSGTYPQTHHASELGTPLAAGIPWLSELFRARGYKTAAFVGSVALDPRNGDAPGFDRGFEVFDAGFTPSAGGPPTGMRSGGAVAAHATKWIQARGSAVPFFVWVHLGDAQFATGSAYDRAVAAEDAAVESLVAALRIAKVFDDAAVVIAADHGQSLGAHGEDLHGVFLYDETMHVPLVLKLPQQQMAGTRVSGRVSLVDVAPTVLEAAGVPVPSQMQGQSLLRIAKTKPTADQSVYARSDFPQQGFGWSALESWRAGRYLYVRAPKPELYDLSADPGSTRNVAQVSKATLDTIAGQLQAFDSHLSGQGSQSASGLSTSEAQKLASLGYVGMERSGGPVNAASSGTDPKDAIAVANKTLAAFASLQQGKVDTALAALQQVANSQPNVFLAQYGVGALLAQRQQYKPAIDALHKAIELQPNSGWAHFAMGVCLVKTADFKTAAVHLELATARLPEFSTAHRYLAETYEKLGKPTEAQAERAKIAAAPDAK